jgi:peptidoglycan/LPS O-acetylase OafA/YrhL
MSRAPEARATNHIRELDGLRAIAVLLVIAWHYIGIPDGPDFWLWKAFYPGHFGVDLFFVLSGFLITTILLENRDSSKYFSSFYARRALRIWPLYYVLVALCLIGWASGKLPALFQGDVPPWTYVFGIQNFWMAKLQSYGSYWLGGTWSLAIEEQFYLVFPLVIRFVPVAVLPRLTIAIIMICPIARLLDSFTGDVFGYYVLPYFRADVLCIGALIAWWRLYGDRSVGIIKGARSLAVGSAVCLPLIVVSGPSTFHAAAWQHTLTGLFFGAILFLILENQGSPQLAWLRTRSMAFFAKTSYCAYLTHHLVAYFIFASLHANRTMTTLQGAILTAISVATTFALCALSYYYFEKPLIGFGHRSFTFDDASPSQGLSVRKV